jgi:hypothetical protein
MSGDVQFNGTPEEWDALVEKSRQNKILTEMMEEDDKDGLYKKQTAKKQTAVEWLWNEIDNLIPYQDINKAQQFNGLLEQAKAMEKEQIVEAHNEGIWIEGKAFDEGEQYYKETYNK